MTLKKRIILLVGLAIGLLATTFGIIKPVSRIDDNTIVISNDILKVFYFNNRDPENPYNLDFDTLSIKQLQLLKKDYIQREVLKREAKKLGLDKIDSIISARLAQLGKEALVGESIDSSIGESKIINFYEENKDKYIEPETITFMHLFFREEELASEYLLRISEEKDPTKIDKLIMNGGTVFPYQKNYSNKARSFILGHFGSEGTKNIFSLNIDNEKWQGPIQSSLGFHLVKVFKRKDERLLNYNEVVSLVRKDYFDKLKKIESKNIIDKKILEYKIIDKLE
ncbi:MAG: peptidylprolyl isomerase [Pseudomonadota bacterium]|nr:peptidylprolyl isomerase [Pseudomonadota bacterium]